MTGITRPEAPAASGDTLAHANRSEQPSERYTLPRPWIWFEDKVLLNIASLFMAAAMGVMFYEASSRSLFSESHWWAEELVRFLVVWSVLLALSAASRDHHFIRMELLIQRLPRGVRMGLNWLNCVLGMAFASVLVYAGCVEVMHLHRIGMMTESSLDLPLWQVRLIMPLGGLLYIGYFLGAALHLLHGVDPFETEELR